MPTPEGQILKACLDYLAARHIFAMRMSVGGLRDSTGRTVRFGVRGMADILALPKEINGFGCYESMEYQEVEQIEPLWIECKAAKGEQSPLQKSFQEQVEREGHRYVIIRSIDDLEGALK
jgi:hypothetical protein